MKGLQQVWSVDPVCASAQRLDFHPHSQDCTRSITAGLSELKTKLRTQLRTQRQALTLFHIVSV